MPDSIYKKSAKIYSGYEDFCFTVVSAIVMVLVSYASPAPDYGTIKGLTFGTATVEDKAKTRASWSTLDVVTSGVVMVAIIGAYLYFTG